MEQKEHDGQGGYPEPRISITPLITPEGLKRRTVEDGPPCLLDLPYRRFVSSGRIAIYLALQHRQLGARNEVLIPAFHCESMVAPVRAMGCSPVFYKVNADTSIDFDDLRAKTTDFTGAVIATHYYGFPQHIGPLQQFCQERGIALIEDCAHSFFGAVDGCPLGSFGDYAIGSAMKFFPILDGGILASRHSDLSAIPLTFPNRKFEIKAFLNPLERSANYLQGRPWFSLGRSILRFKDKAWNLLKSSSRSNGFSISTPSSSEGGFGIDTSWSQVGMSKISRSIMLHTDRNRLVQRRRENYLQLQESLGEMTGARPLFPVLPENTVPLVFPLFVDEPERVFPELKQQRVPIWRFGEYLDPEIDHKVCDNSVTLSRHVLQFPCHQEITADDIEFMITRIRTAVDSNNNPARARHS